MGKTVQVVPHITDAIQHWIERVANIPVDASGKTPDVCIIELGGTVGDIESAPFIEAMRQFQFHVGHDNFALIHVSLVPVVGSVGEQKTKPTQSSVRDLRGLGLTPDFIACRSSKPISKEVAAKLSMFCHVAPECVMAVHDCKSVYHVPLLLKEQGLLSILQTRLKLEPRMTHQAEVLMTKWNQLAERYFKSYTAKLGSMISSRLSLLVNTPRFMILIFPSSNLSSMLRSLATVNSNSNGLKRKILKFKFSRQIPFVSMTRGRN